MNTQPEDVPPADIPRYNWLLCRYPNLLDGSRLIGAAHRNGSSFIRLPQTARLEILGMIKAHSTNTEGRRASLRVALCAVVRFFGVISARPRPSRRWSRP